MASPHPRYEPIMAPPADPVRRRMWGITLAGALPVFFALFTIGQGLYLNSNGVTARAEVVDERYGGRADFVRVRLTSGHETNLWAWTGSPTVGATISVVHLEDRSWAKDSRVFAPAWRLWLGFGLGLWFFCGALVERRRVRCRARPD